MFKHYKLRAILVIILSLACTISVFYYIKAERTHKVIVSEKTTFYTPGQKNNCKWIIHISNDITTEPGSSSSVQIGIPEVIKDGYIAGILQNAPGNSLLLAVKLPAQTRNSPPLVLTHIYNKNKLPIKQARFRVFNSTVLTMVIYNNYESCVEAIME